MKNIYRVLLIVALILGCGVVSLDHYKTNLYLAQIDTATQYNNEQLAQIFAAKDSIQFAAISQEVVHIQARRVAKLESIIERYVDKINLYEQKIILLEGSLNNAAKQIKDLIIDNSKLEVELDFAHKKIKGLEFGEEE